MARSALILFLALIWVGFSNIFTITNIVAGLILAILINRYFSSKSDYSDYTLRPIAFLKLILFTIKELFVSSLLVAREILTKRCYSHPCFVTINVEELTHLSKMIMANLISLTPGTIFIGFKEQENHMEIHSMLAQHPNEVIDFVKNKLQPKIQRTFES